MTYLCWDQERSEGLDLVMLLQLSTKLFYLTGQNCNAQVTVLSVRHFTRREKAAHCQTLVVL